MRDSLEITKKDNGYSVDVMSWRDDEYNVEELVFQDALDVLVEVLRRLGYGSEDIDIVMKVLDEDTAYELTPKGHEVLAQIERERLEAARRGSGRGSSSHWYSTPTEH